MLLEPWGGDALLVDVQLRSRRFRACPSAGLSGRNSSSRIGAPSACPKHCVSVLTTRVAITRIADYEGSSGMQQRPLTALPIPEPSARLVTVVNLRRGSTEPCSHPEFAG